MKQQRGFTMIELMIAMAVIMILAGLLFVGGKYVTGSTKKSTTRTMLQNLKAMTTEREVAVGAAQVRADIDGVFTAAAITANAATLGDVEREFIAQRYPNANPPTAPTNVVAVTQGVINLLIAIPSNRKVLGNVPQAQYLEAQVAGSPWIPPVLLDGYGNPIIAVPSSGLTNVTTAAGTITVKATDGKPFFASAGPDGNFSTGDDNVYSFEN